MIVDMATPLLCYATFCPVQISSVDNLWPVIVITFSSSTIFSIAHLPPPPPFSISRNHDDFSLNIFIGVYIAASNHFRNKSELMKQEDDDDKKYEREGSNERQKAVRAFYVIRDSEPVRSLYVVGIY